jgi:hypothetical protein
LAVGVRAVVADVALTGLGREAWHRFNEGRMDAQMSLCRSPEPPCSSCGRRSRSKAMSTCPPKG